jgi:hypothetical protein
MSTLLWGLLVFAIAFAIFAATIVIVTVGALYFDGLWRTK